MVFARKYDSSIWELITQVEANKGNFAETVSARKNELSGKWYAVSAGGSIIGGIEA